MPLKAISLACLIFAMILDSSCLADSTLLTIDATQRFQTIEGFGACLYLGAAHPYDQPWYQDLYARELGASIVRMELTPWVCGADVTNPVPLGDDIEADIRRMDFSAAGGPSAAGFIRAVNRRKLDRLLLIGSLWTPPHWMKTGDEFRFGHNSSGGHLKMDADNLRQFGRYVAAYVLGFGRYCGVPFYAVSIQNELMFREPYDSCQYTPREYHDAIRAVGLAFEHYGVKTKLMGPESIAPLGKFFTDKQMGWIDAVQGDPATADFLAFFCGHGPGDGAEDLSDYWLRIRGFGRESWTTEWSGEQPDWIHADKNGKPDGALAMACHLNQLLADGNDSAAAYWQCSDGHANLSIQNLMGNTPESAESSAKFAVARQFFRFMRPGAIRLAVTPELPALLASAFVHPRNRTLTIELVNTGNSDESVSIRLPDVPAIRQFNVYRSSANERCAAQADLIASDGAVTVAVPAEAVVTLLGQ
jgi:glucuronoarabinoxylan endo-1,4-beta-xylanase